MLHERSGVPVEPAALHETPSAARGCERQDIRWWRCQACGEVSAEPIGELWEIDDREQVITPPAETDATEHVPLPVQDWVAAWTDPMSCWDEHVDEMLAAGDRIVVWGTSPAAAAFLDRHGVYVLAVVDDDPQRQGRFLAGTAHPVISPESLVAIEPQMVITALPDLVDQVEKIVDDLGLVAHVRDL